MSGVRSWLETHGLEAYAEAFARNEVGLESLPVLTPVDIREELGIRSLEDRRRLYLAIQQLRRAREEGVEFGLEDLPFPIAYPLAFAEDGSADPGTRLQNLVFAAYQALRLTALVLLVDYLERGGGVHKTDLVVRSALRQPHWWDWTRLAGRLAKGASTSASPTIRELAKAWRVVGSASELSAEWEEILRGVPGIHQAQARDANEAFWRARNDGAHRRTTRTGGELADRDALRRFRHVLQRQLQVLFPPGRLELWGQVEAGWVRLHGARRGLGFAREARPPAGAPMCSVLARLGERDLPLDPFALPLPLRCEDDERVSLDVGLIDGLNSKRVVLLGVTRHEDRTDLSEALAERLAACDIDLSREPSQLRRWELAQPVAEEAQAQLEAIRNRRFFPEFYVERSGVDAQVRAALEVPNRGLLLLGEPGSGKTSTLARAVDTLSAPARTGEARDLVVFLQGRTSFQGLGHLRGTEALAEAVARHLGVSPGAFADLAQVCEALDRHADEDLVPDRRVVFVWDALDEAPGFRSLLAALDEWLPALGRYPWLRLVFSLQSKTWQALSAASERPLQNARWLKSFGQAEEEARPFLELERLSKDEAHECYSRRQAERPERACLVLWEELSPSAQRLVRTPLLAHLVHETYRHGGGVPADLDDARLYGDALARLERSLEGLSSTLQLLGDWLWETRSHALPAEVVDGWVEAWQRERDPTERVSQLDPLEQLLEASVLLPSSQRDEGEGRAYAFNHEAIAGQVVLQALLRRAGERSPDGEQLLAWARYAAGEGSGESREPFHAGLSALAELSKRLAVAGDGDAIARLLELDDSSARVRLITAGLVALGPPWGERDEGNAGPNAVLQAIALAAEADPSRRERFVGSTRSAQRVLKRRSHLRAAAALAGIRHGLLRAGPESSPEEILRDCQIANGHGSLVRDAGRDSEAQAILLRVRTLLEPLLDGPEQVAREARRQLCFTLSQLGHLTQDSDERQSLVERGVELGTARVSEEPDDVKAHCDLAFLLNQRGLQLARRDSPERALAEFRAARALLEPIYLADPHRSDLVKVYTFSCAQIAGKALDAGRHREAAEASAHAAKILRAAAELEPRRTDLKRSLYYALSAQAKADHALGASNTALGTYSEAKGILEELNRRPDRRKWVREELVQVEEALASLEGAAS